MKLEELNEAKDNINIGHNRYSVDRGRGSGGNFYIDVTVKDGKVFSKFTNDAGVQMSPANIMHLSDHKNKGTEAKTKAIRVAIRQGALAGKDLVKVLTDTTKYKGWDIDDGSDILTREE
jgi:hypothetical protein